MTVFSLSGSLWVLKYVSISTTSNDALCITTHDGVIHFLSDVEFIPPENKHHDVYILTALTDSVYIFSNK